MAQLGRRRDRAALARDDSSLADQEDDLGVVGFAQADAVAVRQDVFRGRLRPVDERAELRLAVAEPARAVARRRISA